MGVHRLENQVAQGQVTPDRLGLPFGPRLRILGNVFALLHSVTSIQVPTVPPFSTYHFLTSSQ